MISSKGNGVQVAEYAAARRKRELDAATDEEVAKSMAPSKRTSIGLRNALFDEIDMLRRGDGDPARAIAVAKLAATIIDTVRADIQYSKSGLADDPTHKGIQLGTSND